MPIVNGMYYFASQNQGADLPPLVLIHGAGGTHLYWPPQIRRMAGYRVFAPDLPGHGKSGGDRGCQSIREYTQELLKWMEAAGLHRAVFVGHSMGGAIALHLGLEHPDQVLGLGLVSTGAQLPVNPLLLEEASNPATCNRAIEMVVRWSFSPDAPAKLLELASRSMKMTRHSVFYGDLMACNAFDVKERLGEIHCPAVVICGELDKMTPLRASQFLESQIPAARLELVERAGHMVMLEQPDVVARLLHNFLSQQNFLYGELL